jgi:hypothetical protein
MSETHLRAKFRVGDKVLKKRTSKVHTILDSVYSPPVSTHVITVYVDGRRKTELTTISAYYSYKIDDGKSWRYTERTLESRSICPSCIEIGWDWITGCIHCGFSPQDGESQY